MSSQSSPHPRVLINQWSHITDSVLQKSSFFEYCTHTNEIDVLHLWEEIYQQVQSGGLDARPLVHYIVGYLTELPTQQRWTLYCLAKEHHFTQSRAMIWPSLWEISQNNHRMQSGKQREDQYPVVDARERVLTLGERRALARKPNAQSIQKLVYDADPLVMKHLLNNTRMIEAYVLKIAHYSHQQASVLQAIYEHPKWGKRDMIQQALFTHQATPLMIRCILCQVMPLDLLSYYQQQPHTPRVLKQEIQRICSQKANLL